MGDVAIAMQTGGGLATGVGGLDLANIKKTHGDALEVASCGDKRNGDTKDLTGGYGVVKDVGGGEEGTTATSAQQASSFAKVCCTAGMLYYSITKYYH